MNIRGIDFDGIFEANETASNQYLGGSTLWMPQGKGQEEVSDKEKWIWAKPETDDFNFTTRVTYSVEYVQ